MLRKMKKPHKTLPDVKSDLNADRCWAVLTKRAARNTAGFLYAVHTTGIYCRPGCASRLPKRHNVNFFPNVAAAEKAGYRPCKRCRPNEASNIAHYARGVQKACALIEKSDAALSLK